MNTLKITKWFGFILLCLGILSIPLALAGLRSGRDFQDRPSQLNPVQEDGEQMDLLLPGQEVAQTAPNTGMNPGEYYLTGAAKVIDPSGHFFLSKISVNTSAVDPTTGGGHYILAGWAKVVDNTGRLLISLESPVVDPSNGGHYYLAGWAKMVDNTGRLQG